MLNITLQMIFYIYGSGIIWTYRLQLNFPFFITAGFDYLSDMCTDVKGGNLDIGCRHHHRRNIDLLAPAGMQIV